jgi:aryl-alcohol dehydrogenase-like predicted oxidoreductase
MRTLDAIDRVAARHGAKPSQIAIAWLLARPAVSAPSVSATNKSQLDELMGAARLTLASEDIRILEQTT